MYFILFLFTVVKMSAPSKGEFILSTESTVSGMGLEVERLEDFVKRDMTYLALSAHQWEECSDWVLSSLGYIQMEPGDRTSAAREQDRQDEHTLRHADSAGHECSRSVRTLRTHNSHA